MPAPVPLIATGGFAVAAHARIPQTARPALSPSAAKAEMVKRAQLSARRASSPQHSHPGGAQSARASSPRRDNPMRELLGGAGFAAPSKVQKPAAPAETRRLVGSAWRLSSRAAAREQARVAAAASHAALVAPYVRSAADHPVGASRAHRARGAPSSHHRPSTARGLSTVRPSTARSSAGDPLAGYGYITISPIANGAFSQVARAKHLSTQREVAVKTFLKAKYLQQGNEHLAQAMRNEIDVLRKLQPAQHPHVANIVEVLETHTSYVAVLEYCGGGSLQRLLQKSGACDRPHSLGLGEARACSISYQIAAALAHMHALGVAHRDVKPENVLFTDTDMSQVRTAHTLSHTLTLTLTHTHSLSHTHTHSHTHTLSLCSLAHAPPLLLRPLPTGKALRLWLRRRVRRPQGPYRLWHAPVHGARD